ncbi:ornithine cyclodeaminase [Novosphingobium sp. PC22D]|uniref:ornithine cyclodeaminase family protein n=1 Tax=Novosphingobium sp. PC22D TaxID=1962403 RepID=UPI000BF06D5A|nr:ornithine cyclodeaminase family protein [Novosphingobium sp. PC22D]PEQ12393.1 ornithine cyclodeaminase [Novosphingobium sp. PC22D]
MIVIDREEVVRRLDHATCIGLVREAMIALAEGRTQQLLRGIIDLGGGDLFGVMPGAIDGAGFGVKVVSVFPGAPGGRSHQGVIVVFNRETGAPAAVIEGGEVTAIRTGCASAVATGVLANEDAHRLAVLGTGEQAWQHIAAIRHVRALSQVTVWGRDTAKAAALAGRVERELQLAARTSPDVPGAVAEADIICTVTAADKPVLFSRDVPDGAHVNVVGSSRPGPAEIDTALVARARFFPDHREGVLAQGAEFLKAREAGLVTDDHVLPELGHVLNGGTPGRLSRTDVTIYKSLGSIVQDLACAAYLAGV